MTASYDRDAMQEAIGLMTALNSTLKRRGGDDEVMPVVRNLLALAHTSGPLIQNRTIAYLSKVTHNPAYCGHCPALRRVALPDAAALEESLGGMVKREAGRWGNAALAATGNQKAQGRADVDATTRMLWGLWRRYLGQNGKTPQGQQTSQNLMHFLHANFGPTISDAITGNTPASYTDKTKTGTGPAANQNPMGNLRPGPTANQNVPGGARGQTDIRAVPNAAPLAANDAAPAPANTAAPTMAANTAAQPVAQPANAPPSPTEQATNAAPQSVESLVPRLFMAFRAPEFDAASASRMINDLIAQARANPAERQNVYGILNNLKNNPSAVARMPSLANIRTESLRPRGKPLSEAATAAAMPYSPPPVAPQAAAAAAPPPPAPPARPPQGPPQGPSQGPPQGPPAPAPDGGVLSRDQMFGIFQKVAQLLLRNNMVTLSNSNGTEVASPDNGTLAKPGPGPANAAVEPGAATATPNATLAQQALGGVLNKATLQRNVRSLSDDELKVFDDVLTRSRGRTLQSYLAQGVIDRMDGPTAALLVQASPQWGSLQTATLNKASIAAMGKASPGQAGTATALTNVMGLGAQPRFKDLVTKLKTTPLPGSAAMLLMALRAIQ